MKNCLEILREKNIDIYAPCGGKGNCGKCKVKIIGKTSSLSIEEKKYLTEKEIEAGVRLACKTQVGEYEDIVVLREELENNSKNKISKEKYFVNTEFRRKKVILEKPTLERSFSVSELIKKEFNNKVDIDLSVLKKFAEYPIYEEEIEFLIEENKIIRYENNREINIYGIAVDIGTTTIAVYLVNIEKGEVIDIDSFQNPQYIYGSDLISRLGYIESNNFGLGTLNKILIKGLNKSFERLLKRNKLEKDDILRCIFTGNSVMSHIFLNLNPVSLAKIPFNLVIKDIVEEKAGYFNLNILNKDTEVIVFPNIGGFVGGDTVAAMLAGEYLKDERVKLLLDLGTNGEIALYHKGKIYVCSAAAGPAFEGANIKYGMQAFSGAINKVEFKDGKFNYTTIGNKKASGICGSGIIDLLSIMLENNIISLSGKFNKIEKIKEKSLVERLIEVDGKKVFIIAYEEESENGEKIFFTQKDIREIQLAKSAIRAGINLLLKSCNIRAEEIEIFYVAGTFGNYINKENALNIGLLPPKYKDKIEVIGNAAGKGCVKLLCDYELKDKLNKYLEISEHVEISNHKEFQEEFLKEMSF